MKPGVFAHGLGAGAAGTRRGPAASFEGIHSIPRSGCRHSGLDYCGKDGYHSYPPRFEERKRMKKLLALIVLAGGISAAPQVLDCLAAVVNNQSITLVDVRIAETFGFYDEEIQDRPGVRRRLILEKLIDQKVVLDLVREPAALDESELAASMSEIVSRLGPEEFAAALREFGFGRDDLAVYLGEILHFRRVLAARFDQGVTVSLREIEAHYQDVYLPAMREAGRNPEPLLQVLDDIEAEIKTTKKAVMIKEWIAHIRSQAEIRILPDCLDNEFQEKAP